jgi:hypothetical protein
VLNDAGGVVNRGWCGYVVVFVLLFGVVYVWLGTWKIACDEYVSCMWVMLVQVTMYLGMCPPCG